LERNGAITACKSIGGVCTFQFNNKPLGGGLQADCGMTLRWLVKCSEEATLVSGAESG